MDAHADDLPLGLDENGADDDFSLTCPACGADLVHDELFLRYRVCEDCGRHFSLPARERVGVLVDEGSFRPIREMPTLDEFDNDQISALDRIADLRERPVLDEAIVTGTGKIGGTRAVVIALDDQYVSAQIGALGAEKVIIALEHAHTRRLPVVMIVAGGGAGVQAGPLAAVQGARISSVASQLRRDGLPMIAVLTHPTSASIFNTIASQADIIYAEHGTHVGVSWSAGPSIDDVGKAMAETELLKHGWIDGIVARQDLHGSLARVLGLISKRQDVDGAASPSPDAFSSHGLALLSMVSSFVEIRGDRVETDDRHLVCGFGRLDDHVVAIAVQDPSTELAGDSRPVMRKLQRLAQLAGRFEMPLIMVGDGPARERPARVTPGESLAAAKLGSTLATLPVSVISVGAGTVQGLASAVMMSGDRRVMLEGATYHLPVNTLHRGGRVPTQAAGHYWTARECERLGLVDGIIEEPPAGLSDDPLVTARMLKGELVYLLTELSRVGPRRLVEIRQRRHRMLGQETEAGLAALRGELRDWQEMQQSVAKSIEEWRERVGQRMQSQPRLSFQRPDLGEIAARLKARQEELRHELLERTGRSDRSGK